MTDIIYTCIADVNEVQLPIWGDDGEVSIEYGSGKGDQTIVRYSQEGLRYRLTNFGEGDIMLEFDPEWGLHPRWGLVREAFVSSREEKSKILRAELTRLCGQDPWKADGRTIWPVMLSNITGIEKHMSYKFTEPDTERPEDLPADAWTLIQE